MNSPRIIAVVDQHPRFLCEAVLWALCALENSQSPLGIVSIGELPTELANWFWERGIDVRQGETLFPESPHCNKILAGKLFKGEPIVITDCDVFVLQDFTSLLQSQEIRLAENNHGNPSIEIFDAIFAAYGFQTRPEIGVSLLGDNRETYALNVSCGVAYFPESLSHIFSVWEKMAAWLIDNRDLMGRYKVHVDQTALTMALHETKAPFRHLPPQTNTVLELLPKISTPYALHLTSGHIPQFPHYFDAQGRFERDEFKEGLHAHLSQFNKKVDEARRLLSEFPATRDFQHNFLNPNWKR